MVEKLIYYSYYFLKEGRSGCLLLSLSSTTRSFYILLVSFSTIVGRMFPLRCLLYLSPGRIPFMPNLFQNSENLAQKRLVDIWRILKVFSLLFLFSFTKYWLQIIFGSLLPQRSLLCFFSFLFCQSILLRCISILLVVCGNHQLERYGVFLLMKQKEVGYWIWMEVQPLRS